MFNKREVLTDENQGPRILTDQEINAVSGGAARVAVNVPGATPEQARVGGINGPSIFPASIAEIMAPPLFRNI